MDKSSKKRVNYQLNALFPYDKPSLCIKLVCPAGLWPPARSCPTNPGVEERQVEVFFSSAQKQFQLKEFK
jgi:hypothetical protein